MNNMKAKKLHTDERYSRVAVRAKLSVEVEQKKRLGAWGRRVLVLDGATLYAYKVKGEGGSVGGWSVGGADVHVGKSSDDGRHLLVISRPPAYKLTFSFTTTYEQARMIQALSSSGATVTGLEAIMLLKNLRKKQQQEQEEKEEERKRLTMEEGLILQTLPYPEDLLRGGGGGGGGETGRDEHKEEIKTGADKEEEADQNTEGKGEEGEKVQQVEEGEQEEDEEEEISQAVYNYMAFSSMFSNSSVTKESGKREETEENERQTENEAEEQEEEVNQDERDSREERRSNEDEMNYNDKRKDEEENAVQQNPSYQTTTTASQPPHTTPLPSTASGGGAGEGQRVEARVNPLPKPPRVSQVPEGRPTDSKQTISSASEPQSTPAGQEGNRVVLEQSEDREEVTNGVTEKGGEEREALLKGERVKESEDKEILVKKINEESKGVISDNPTLDLSLLRDRQKEEEEKKEQEQREREKEEENSEIKEDKPNHNTLQNETVKEVKEDKRKEEDKKEEDKEQDKETYSQLVTTMRLDRSFTLDTHAPSSAPSSELSSPSDEAVLLSPTSPSSPKSPLVHSPTLENTKSSDNEEDRKEESWVSDVFSDSEEQFEKLYNELSKTLNQPSQPEDEIYNSNGNTETEESSVVTPEEPTEKHTIVTPDEPKEESTVVTPDESKEESTVVTPKEPREEITVVPLKESDSTPQKTELKRTNSIIKRRDGDGSQSSSSSNKKVQFDPNVQSIDLPPDPPLHDLPQVKENGEARPGVTLIREKTGKNTTQVKTNDSVATKARKIEENKRKTSPGPSSPVRKKPQVSSPVKTTRSVTSGDGVTKKRDGSVRTPSPVTPSSPSKTLRKTETEDKKTKKTVSEDKTKKTVSEDKTRKVERKEEIKKVGKDEKTEDTPGQKEEAKKVMDKEEKSAMKKTEQEENKAKTKAEDTKKTIDTKTKEEKTQIKIKTEAKDEGRKTTTTITTTNTTIKQLTSKAVEVKGAGSVSNVKRQSTVDLQAPLVISGQVEMGGSIGGRLNARRVEVRDGHILAFISHASTPSSRLPLAGLSVTPMLGSPGGAGGGGAGTSLILTRASRCMMILKLRSREEMMHWIHTLSDEVLRVTPEENLKGLTLYPSPEQKEEKKEEEETNEEKEEEEKEGEEDSGSKSTLREEGEDVTKEEERPKEKEETEEESELEEKEVENREEPEAEDREVREESSDESLKKEEPPGTITQRKQEKSVNAEEKSTKDNHSLPSQPQRKQEESPKENGEVEKDSPARKRIITSPNFMEHLNKFREQQKTEIQVKRAGKDEDDDQMNPEGRKGVNRKPGNKLEETISNKIAALIKEAEGRDREAGRERRESVGGREGRKAGRGAGEERDTKAGTGEAGKEGRRVLIAGREGGKTGKVAGEERDTKAGTEGDGEGTEGSDTGGDIQVEIRKHPGRKNKDEGRIGGLTHPPLKRVSGQGKSPSQSPLASPLTSPLTSPRVGEDVVDNFLLLNIRPEKALPTTITTTTTITKATTATTTTTTSTTTTTTPKSVHHTTTATSKRTPPHTTTHHNHNTTTTPTNRHANCFKPNDPISSFNRSISASNTSLAHDEGRKAHTETLKRFTSDIEINKGRKEGSLTRKGAVKIKNSGNRTSKQDRERVSEGDVSEAINTEGTTLSSVISSRILAAKNIEIIERQDRKGSESEDTEDKENEAWNQEAHKRAMNVSLRKDEEERGGRGKQEVESNITWSVAATREKFELLCSVSGENKGKLTTKTPISRRRSTRLSQKRRRTQELNAATPRRQGSVRRSFIATDDDQSIERESITRQRSVQSRESSIEVEDSISVAEEKGVEKGAMRRLGGLSNSTTSQDEEYNQGTQKESARRQGSWPTKDTVQEARKAFERYSTRTTSTTTADKAARHDSGIQKEKLTAKKSPLSRTQNILQGSPMSISESGHEDEEFRSPSPPPFARTSTMQSRNDDVVICWRGPYIAQESEQEVLNNISNAFLAKRRLLNKEVAMGRLQGRLHLLEEHLWGLQARLATEEQVAGGDRKSVERALRSVEEEIDHVTSRLSMVQKEAHQAREKLAAALATGLSQWCDKTGITPRSSLTRRAKEHHRQEEEEEEEEEYMEEESEA